MNKKIESIQKKLTEAIANRERTKVRYDAHVIILEGQRRTLSDMENMNRNLLEELTESNVKVGELNIDLQVAIDEEHQKETI